MTIEKQQEKFEIKPFLHNILISRKDDIEAWFDEKYGSTPKLFYSSVDVRHSGYKLAPVDTNLFPAGFNLLTEHQRQNASDQATLYFKKNFPAAKKLLLITESHTRNKYYLQNVYSIKNIMENAGMEVRLSRFDITTDEEHETAEGQKIIYNPLSRNGDKLILGDFTPDIILVNNDMTGGIPEILNNIKQPAFPPLDMGWHRRRKTGHFESYGIVARDFGRKFEIDPWLISTLFTRCGNINFRTKEGLECVTYNASEILKKIKIKYDQYEIDEEPYIFVKANSGTYGMGIMVVKDPAEIEEINKKERHSLSNIKEGVENSEVIIQEGIPTIDTLNGFTAEPLMYLVNSAPVGCTYRINSNQDKFGNLNSKGMTFQNSECEEKQSAIDCPVQGFIARLASLAAARECYEINWDI